MGELFKRVRTMPKNAPGSLTDEVYREIVAYLLSANGFPAGKKGLSDMDHIVIASPLEGEVGSAKR